MSGGGGGWEASPDQLPWGDAEVVELVGAHVERHLGPIDFVFHEIVSDRVHIDVHVVPPTRERPHYALVTSGMSALPMRTPPELGDLAYAELMVELPAEWPLTEEAMRDPRNWWPIGQLKLLARYPHEFGTWLGLGHSMPNGDPPEPFAPGTELCGMMLVPPVSAPEAFWSMDAPGRGQVRFLSLLPLYQEEMDLKLREGADALLERMDAHGLSLVIDPRRPNVAARRRWRFFN